MSIEIDAEIVRTMFLGGAANLEANKDWINELNVFPVPDGDTGTNMTLTVQSAVREVGNIEQLDMETLSKAISSGSLRGARGNSGVIMSQLFRGFTKEIREHETLTIKDLAIAMQRATETAYKAVMKPKEGTILTVAKGVSDKAEELSASDMSVEEFVSAVIEHGDKVLDSTPELLPVLKQAGVVDSGGQGLMQFLKGAYAAFTGEEIDISMNTTSSSSLADMVIEDDYTNITFGYCTEFIVNIENEYDINTEIDFKRYLDSIGDCVVVVSDDDVIKVHVHTDNPGLAIQRALTYGNLTHMKIDNMREEAKEKHERLEKKAKLDSSKQDEPRKTFGFIAIAAGSGLADIFRDLGVDEVIEGGQTMNPSTDDVLAAAEKINADNIFVLPNNSNIILAANQAADIIEDKKIIVIPTKSSPQGISAMISFDENISFEENESAMNEAIEFVKTGQITYAVRDTTIDDKEIHENDIMGLGDHSTLLALGNDIETVAREMVDAMVDEDSNIISIYYGDSITEDEAERLGCQIEAAYPDLDVEVNCGNQPVYYYIISVE